MLALPEPQRGGSIDELRPFVNVRTDDDGRDFALAVGWLVASLRPKGPYPLLAVQGEQGSAKSTLARALRSLIDPNSAGLRSQPKDLRDLAIAANNSWCLSFDNLSKVPGWLSDGMCRLATGGGFATRALYTDGEEIIFDAQRPILINGIDSVATRSDLLDRSILLSLPRLTQYRQESVFWLDFERSRPRILGALLDSVSTALRHIGEIESDVPVRMADAARWVQAAESALPWEPGLFGVAYEQNRQDANIIALQESPFAVELGVFMQEKGVFEGTASELLKLLAERVNETTKRLDGWPKSARGASSILRRIAPNLRGLGYRVDFPPRKSDKRPIRIQAPGTPGSSAEHERDCHDGHDRHEETKHSYNSANYKSANNDGSDDDPQHETDQTSPGGAPGDPQNTGEDDGSDGRAPPFEEAPGHNESEFF
jgi:hypothetical protein